MLTQSSAAVMPTRHNVVYRGGWRRIIHKKLGGGGHLLQFNFQKVNMRSEVSNLCLKTLNWSHLREFVY